MYIPSGISNSSKSPYFFKKKHPRWTPLDPRIDAAAAYLKVRFGSRFTPGSSVDSVT